jgi:hypothetical protein
MSKPKHWPEFFPYLRSPLHDKSLTPSHLQSLRTKPTADDDMTVIPSSAHPATPNPLVRIEPISIPSHPANGQCGLFAAKDLPAGSFIMPYLGRMHSGAASAAESDYDLWLDRGVDVAVDAASEGNEGRYVNDFRGVRERANAEFRTVWCERFGELCVGVWVIGGGGGGKNGKGKGKVKARGGIMRGEEICVSYGKGFWGERKAEMEEEEKREREGQGEIREEVGDASGRLS